jgi:hypothetical protein
VNWIYTKAALSRREAEVLRLHAAKQEATIAQLKAGMDALAATVKQQATQIQKVSAQLEASKPPPQVVANNH